MVGSRAALLRGGGGGAASGGGGVWRGWGRWARALDAQRVHVQDCVAAPRDAIDEAVKLVESLGASSYFLDPDEHDGLVASVSHLPYLMSVGLIGHLGREKSWRETASLAAGGFAYTTHLADSDPQMFADIMRTNRDNVARRLDLFIAELESLRDAIAADSPGLKEQFLRAQHLHQDWPGGRAQGQPSESETPL